MNQLYIANATKEPIPLSRRPALATSMPGFRDVDGRLSRRRRPALAGRSHRGNNCEEPGSFYKQRISRIKRIIKQRISWIKRIIKQRISRIKRMI